MYQDNENVNFFLEEIQQTQDPLDTFDINNYPVYNNKNDHGYENVDDDLTFSQIIHYNENFTIKELMIICEYYGISKDLKANKSTKEVIVHFLVDFESMPSNEEIVSTRKNLWFYINELKNDKFMKKYVLW